MNNKLGIVYSWEKVQDFTFDDLICLNSSLKTNFVSLDQISCRRAIGINFYRGFELFEIKQISWPYPTRLFFNRQNGTAFKLDGTNQTIYYFNERFRIFEKDFNKEERLVDEKCRRYIRFYFDNVEGRHGMFNIFEDYDELVHNVRLYYQSEPEKLREWESGVDSVLTTKIVRDYIYPFATNEDKGFGMRLINNSSNQDEFRRTYSAHILFKGNMFFCHITVYSDLKEHWGQIELSNENLVLDRKKDSPLTHELQEWGQIFDRYKFNEQLPPLHKMQIKLF